MSRLSDEKLVARATHAGRNLGALAAIVSLLSAGLIGAVFFSKAQLPFLVWMAGTVTLVAIGYWLLAVAAKRGNPASVGTVIVLMTLQLVLTLVFSAVAAAKKAGTETWSNTPGAVISLLVISSLYNSWHVLKELQTRGLWNPIFGAARPSGHLCALGGLALAVGFLGVSCVGFCVERDTLSGHQEVVRQARIFKDIVANEETALLRVMESMADTYTSEQLQMAETKAVELERALDALRAETADGTPLGAVLETYDGAVRQWKSCLEMMRSSAPDVERARQMLILAGKMRSEAILNFNRHFESFNANPN